MNESQPPLMHLVLVLGIVVCGVLVMLGTLARLPRFLLLTGIVWAAVAPAGLLAGFRSLVIPAALVWLLAIHLLFRKRK